MKIIHLLYKTTNIINKKTYVGVHSTTNINDGYLGTGSAIKAAIRKYGKENFKREIIAECGSRDVALYLESIIVTKEFINEKTNYNLKTGGVGGCKHSDKTKKQMSKSSKGQTAWNKGVTYSAETRKRMSESHKGNVLSDETKEKCRQVQLNLGENHHRTETIEVYDEKNQLQYTSKGGFGRFCKEQNLPHYALTQSYKNNGSKIHLTKSQHRAIINKGIKVLPGWYAINKKQKEKYNGNK